MHELRMNIQRPFQNTANAGDTSPRNRFDASLDSSTRGLAIHCVYVYWSSVEATFSLCDTAIGEGSTPVVEGGGYSFIVVGIRSVSE